MLANDRPVEEHDTISYGLSLEADWPYGDLGNSQMGLSENQHMNEQCADLIGDGCPDRY